MVLFKKTGGKANRKIKNSLLYCCVFRAAGSLPTMPAASSTLLQGSSFLPRVLPQNALRPGSECIMINIPQLSFPRQPQLSRQIFRGQDGLQCEAHASMSALRLGSEFIAMHSGQRRSLIEGAAGSSKGCLQL